MAPMTTTTTGEMAALAQAFAVALRRQLSLKALETIDAANVGSEERCASLDWTDAHEAMDIAFFSIRKRAFSTDDPGDALLWKLAWYYARAVGFAVLARKAVAP
jgi:hypothetical protein